MPTRCQLLLLSLAPDWSLTVALYKWPEVQRKLERRKRQEQLRLQRTQSLNSPVDAPVGTGVGSAPADEHGAIVDTIVPVVAATPGATIAPPTPIITSGATTRARTRRRLHGPRAPSGSAHFPTPSLSEWQLPRTATSEWHELAHYPHSPG